MGQATVMTSAQVLLHLLAKPYDRPPSDTTPADHAQQPRSYGTPQQPSVHTMAYLGTHMSHSQIDSVRSHCTSQTQQLITHILYSLVHTLSQTTVPVNQPHYIYRSPCIHLST